MKRLLVGMLGVALLSSALVVNAHQGDMNKEEQSMVSRADMMQMREHMGRTESIMGDIQSNKQPEKRQELMHEHMKQMRMGMDMMHDSDGVMGSEKGKEKDKSDSCPHMDNRMGMMEDRMQMMQKMMRQMMEHQSQRDMPMNR